VAVKTVYRWLLQQTRERFGVALGEAEQVAQKGYLLLSRTLVKRSEEQVLFAAVAGKDVHRKRPVQELARQEVALTPWSHDDLELQREFGLKAVQNARLARLIEEAYWQNASLSTSMLCLLTHITAKSIRERLVPLWEAGIRLAVAGTAKKYRNGRTFRATAALEQFFAGESPAIIRERLWLSLTAWQQYQVDFLHVAQLKQGGLDAPTVARRLGLHLDLVAEYQDLDRRTGGAARLAELLSGRLAQTPPVPLTSEDPRALLLAELQAQHNFSPAKAHSYLALLEDLADEDLTQDRPPQTVVYYAVAEHEPPGKALNACTLVPVQLSYYHSADQSVSSLDATSDLKWQRLLRYTTEARAQGGLLTQPDLAFLLGVHPGVIQRLMKEHPGIIVPTRGNIADMGPGLTHVAKVVELYLQGYTETEIVRRTGHSYESVENYLLTFAKVVGLTERGMPLPLIRKTTGCSMKLVERHAALYQKYNTPDYQFTLMQLRRVFERHGSKKGH
jgi:hypothetical protein